MVKSIPAGSVGGVFDHIVGDGVAAVVGCGPVECDCLVAACGGEVCWCGGCCRGYEEEVDIAYGVGPFNRFGGGSVAGLAVAVPSPAPECVVGFGGARVRSPGADVVPGGASDLFWACSVGGGSVAELAVAVVAPSPECVVGFGGTCVKLSGADVVPGGASDLCWACSVVGGSVAELAVAVVAPAPECVVGFGGTCMTTACSYRFH